MTPILFGDIVFSHAGLSVNTHTISLQVADEVGATCTVLRTFTVGTPPGVMISSPANGDVWNEGSPISLGATVSDAQDQPDNVSRVGDGNVFLPKVLQVQVRRYLPMVR